VVEDEEADELLQEPSAADIRELHGTAQSLEHGEPRMKRGYGQNPGTAGASKSYRFQMSIKGIQAALWQPNNPRIPSQMKTKFKNTHRRALAQTG